jgi:hypothetical protein
MAKTAIVSEELAKKFASEKDSPYTRWVRNEGLDIIGAHYMPNLHTVELKPWARRTFASKASPSSSRWVLMISVNVCFKLFYLPVISGDLGFVFSDGDKVPNDFN